MLLTLFLTSISAAAAAQASADVQEPATALGPPVAVAEAGTGTWTSFRGSGGRGVVEAHPIEWSATTNLAWKVSVPGGGWSSPIVIGDHVYVTTAFEEGSEDSGRPLSFADSVRRPESMGAGAKQPEVEFVFQLRAYALKDGELVFAKDVCKGTPAYGVHPSNTFATETPATDGERIVCYFGMIGKVAAFDLEGKALWSRDVGTYKMNADFGTGSSVLIAGERAVIQSDNNEASFLAAFDLGTGEPAWRVERPEGSAWASPILWQRGDRAEVVACGPGTVMGYDPSTGDVAWRAEGIRGSFSSTPFANDDRIVFGNSGPMSRGPLIALDAAVKGDVDLGGDDDAENSPVLWNIGRAGPGFSSPIGVGDLIWVINSQGILTCRNGATGEEVYDERLPDVRSIVACPWTDGEHIFILSEAGKTVVVEAGPEFKVVGTNEIEGVYWSTPSAAGGALFLRSVDTMYCVRASD